MLRPPAFTPARTACAAAVAFGSFALGCTEAEPVVIGNPAATASTPAARPAAVNRPAPAAGTGAPTARTGAGGLPPLIGGNPEPAPLATPVGPVTVDPATDDETPMIAQGDVGGDEPAEMTDAAPVPEGQPDDSRQSEGGDAAAVADSDSVEGVPADPEAAAKRPEAPVERFIEMVLDRQTTGYRSVLVRRPESTQLRMLLKGDVDEEFMDLAVSSVQGAVYDSTYPQRRTQIVKYTKTDGTVLGFTVDLEEGEWKVENLSVNKVSTY